MATDVARIGFGVETSQLEKGISTLSTFSTSAKSANASAQSIGTAMNKAAVTFAGAVAGMSKSIASFVSATKTATVEEVAAAKEASDFANSIYLTAQAQDKLTVSTQKTTRSLQNMYAVMLKTASNESVLDRINRVTGVTGLLGDSAEQSAKFFKQSTTKEEWNALTGSIARDQMPNRFNTANIAAQFQDIGVTAAMGMNPLLIALQQGTQLSAVLNTMDKPLQGLSDALKQVINSTALWSIGLTALVAVLIQSVDWGKTFDGTLDVISAGFDTATNNVEIFTAGLAGLTVAGVLTTFSSLSSTMSTLGKVLKPVITLFTRLATVVGTLLTSKFTIVTAIVTGVVYAFSKLRQYLEDTTGFDISFGLWDKLTGLIQKATSALRDFFSSSSDGMENWKKISESTSKEIDDLITEFNALQMNDFDAVKYRKQMELFDKSVEELIDLSDKMGISMRPGFDLVEELAEQYATWDKKVKDLKKSLDDARKVVETWDKILEDHQKRLNDVNFATQTLGLNTYDLTRLERERAMIESAQKGGIDINSLIPGTDETYISRIEKMAEEEAKLSSENENLTNSFDFAKESVGSFFSEMRDGLTEGMSLWESFGNAVTNVLDSMLDKMLDVGVDLLFEGLGSIGTKGGESKFSWGNIASSIGSFFGGGASIPAAAAKGGAFTNGVYNSPTLFKFANGGQFGVMGEAGPEAVMPLKRGPDGSLGVATDGVMGGNVIVNVINNSNASATVRQRETQQGTEIDVLIDKTVADKLNQQGSYSNTALTRFSNRQLIKR